MDPKNGRIGDGLPFFLVIGWLMRDDWFTIASLILIGWLFGLLG
jgi:hypothetical protein